MTKTRGISSFSLIFLLFSLFFFLILSWLHHYHTSSALRATLLGLAGLALVSVGLIVVARTTMVAWITVLVLLAFSGKRRRVLAHESRKITADVALNLIMVMLKERGFFTVICATAVSLMAMAQVIRV